ncbi:MAG: TadE/TadG family type IV pilus assembly protein [Hyphomicrobium sp.]|nr:TadE/TadG family type IV pilus assembly protein [Hyphomicrobium sp.]
MNTPKVAGKKFYYDVSGAPALEFALILPVFMLLLGGMLAYGMYIGASHGVAQLAADAARVSVAGLSAEERKTLAQSHIEKHASNYAFVDPTRISIDAAASPDDPSQFQVSVRYSTDDLPIWMLEGLVPLPEKTIVRTASIKSSGF